MGLCGVANPQLPLLIVCLLMSFKYLMEVAALYFKHFLLR